MDNQSKSYKQGEMGADYRHRIADMLSAAGVGFRQTSQEVVYMMPQEFMERYIQLWYAALGPLVRGPMSGNERDGDLGLAHTSTNKKGQMPGAGAGGIGKRLARNFGLKDEQAFKLKERIDKRLRDIARDLRRELGDIEARQLGGWGSSGALGGMVSQGAQAIAEELGVEGMEQGGKVLRGTGGRFRARQSTSTGGQKSAPKSTTQEFCRGCRRILHRKWGFCPTCGLGIFRENPEEKSGKKDE